MNQQVVVVAEPCRYGISKAKPGKISAREAFTLAEIAYYSNGGALNHERATLALKRSAASSIKRVPRGERIKVQGLGLHPNPILIIKLLEVEETPAPPTVDKPQRQRKRRKKK